MSTTNHEWARVRGLLERAMELDGEPRAHFLDESCAGDASLRRELEQLLARDHGEWLILRPGRITTSAGGAAELAAHRAQLPADP